MTLTDFLLARLAEDERDADCVVWDNGGMNFEPYRARVLAECEAKRLIVERYGDAARGVMCLLATIYADHPDYREEWAL